MMEELRRICVSLESGKLSLEESLKVYERGVQLQLLLNQKLTAAERRVVELVKPDGTVETFDIKLPSR